MLQTLNDWFHRYFSHPQAILLAILLTVGFAIIIGMGQMLAPVLASLVLAYLLEGLIWKLEKWRTPRLAAVLIVYCLFMMLVLFILLVVLPLVSRQLAQLVQELPGMLNSGQQLLVQLPERYPNLVSAEQIRNMMVELRTSLTATGQNILSYSLASIPALITALVYLILVPLLVFFFLKDKTLLTNWFKSFLPTDRAIAGALWEEMDRQMGNYVRGKFYEILIVGGVSYVTFALMGLNYAPLLAVLVGLSVIIPYIGASVVTLPVMLVAYFQWGWGTEFIWLTVAYFVIQILDGNVLVPLLFSEAVNLHPVAIIVAILVFGGLWGFWGVFFAIPLATLVKALLAAWPRAPLYEEEQSRRQLKLKGV